MRNIVRVLVAVSALSLFCTVRPAGAYVGCQYCTSIYELSQIACDAQEYGCELAGVSAGGAAGGALANAMKAASAAAKGAAAGVTGLVVAGVTALACLALVGDCRAQAEDINRNCIDLYCRPTTSPMPTYGTGDPANP